MDESAMSNILGALINKDNDWGGNGGIWVIFLLFMMMFWGGNWNGRNGTDTALANYATQSDLINGFNAQNINTQLQGINTNLNTLGYNGLSQATNINQNVSQQGYNVQSAICGASNNIQQTINAQGNGIMMGMVQGNNAIVQGLNQNRFDSAQQTCNITETSTRNTQAILDKLCEMKNDMANQRINDLQVRNQALELQMGNLMQTQNLVSTLRPYPQPAYITSSPYASTINAGLSIT